MGPNIFLPTAVVFPAQDGPLDHKDLQPRFGATYDVFGNGKTAVKFFLGEYVTTVNTIDEWVNFSPAGLGHFVSQRQRTWIDANHDFVPNCNLLDQSAQNDPNLAGLQRDERQLRRRESLLREGHLSAHGRSGGHDRLEHAGAQLGSDGRHFSAARPEGVGRRDLQPAELGQHRDDDQPRPEADRLQPVHVHACRRIPSCRAAAGTP